MKVKHKMIMTSLKSTFLVFKTHSALQSQIKAFSYATQLLEWRKNPLFLKNRFKILRDHPFRKEPPKKINPGVVAAVRKPYLRPKIQQWKTYQEIPYHYREGRNKTLLIPHGKKIRIKKYKNQYEERPFYRSAVQRLLNRGRSLIPYDKKISVITGKHTGPGVEGGSELAQKLAALHLVQPTGYVDKHGNFKQVKEMIPEFVVPNLDDCKMKPYVSYRATEINQSKFTARSLYNAFYGEEAKKKFEEETGIKTNLEIQQTESPKKTSSWKPWKKEKS